MSVVLILIVSVAFCTCWHGKTDNKSKLKHVYVLDENGLKKVAVRRLEKIKKQNNAAKLFTSTNIDVLKDETMSSDRLPRRETEGRYLQFSDGTDFKSQFDDCKIEINVDAEEMLSCHSGDSRNTFYSTYPLLRTLSTTETVRSLDSYNSVQ